MSKTLFFKPEHERKLKKLKIKTEFCRELRRKYPNGKQADTMYPYTLKKFMERQKEWNFSEFVSWAFTWAETARGHSFWLIISGK